jgi:hypothetical protein
MEFYSVSAQVLFAMFVVLAYEARLLTKASFYDEDKVYLNVAATIGILTTMVALVAGEYAALGALFSDKATPWNGLLVRNGLFWGAGAILIPFVHVQLGYLWRGIKDSITWTLFCMILFGAFAYCTLGMIEKL